MSLSRIVDEPDMNLCDPHHYSPGLYTIQADERNEFIEMDAKASWFNIGLTGNTFYFKNIKKYENGVGFTCNMFDRASRKPVGIPYDVGYYSYYTIGLVDNVQEWSFIFVKEKAVYNLSVVFNKIRYFLFYFPEISKPYSRLVAIPEEIIAPGPKRDQFMMVYGITDLKSLKDGFFIVGNFICSDPPCSDNYPTTDINFCQGDCVKDPIKLPDGSWQCQYNMNNVTSAFLKQWSSAGWTFPDWTAEQKDNICSELDNPFDAPGDICSGNPTTAKDKYCLASVSNLFSPDCLDYIKAEPENKKTEIRTIFANKLDEICSKVNAGVTIDNSLPMDDIINTCNCVFNDAEREQAIAKMKREYDDDGKYLNTLFSKPINCWVDKCQSKNVPLLKNYNDCGNLIYCVEKVNVDVDGDVSKIDINQSEQCKNMIKKKVVPDSGGGTKKNLTWLWVVLGLILASIVAYGVYRIRVSQQ